MRSYSTVLPLTLLTLALFVPVIGASAQEVQFIPGRLVVNVAYDNHNRTFEEVTSLESINEKNELLGVEHTWVLRSINAIMYVLKFDESSDMSALAEAYRESDDVVEAYPAFMMEVTATTPNDPFFASDQWNLDRLDAPEAWDITRGSSSTSLGIIDTGLSFRHPDLVNNIWVNVGEDVDSDGVIVPYGGSYMFDPDDLNGVDDDGNGYVDDLIGWDFYDGDNDPTQVTGTHGTKVAGAAIAGTNNSIGVSGINWYGRLAGLRVGDGNGIGYWEPAIDYAAMMGIDIVNMSFGYMTEFTPYCPSVLMAAYNLGTTLVGAAGNNSYTGTVNSFVPASCPGVLTVSAVEQNDARYWAANAMPSVDVVTPYYTWTTYVDVALPGLYGYLWGFQTSIASPQAAGVASLLLSVNPSLTPANIETILENSADNVYGVNPSLVGLLGAGRVNAYKAVRYTLEHFGGTIGGNGETVTLYASLTTDPGISINIRPGTTVRMAPGVSLGLKGAVNWTATAAAPIRFERLGSSSSAWGTVGLLADGNVLEYVVFDGGFKNIDVASRNNTLRYVTSRNGWRNLSSGAPYTGTGRSQVTVIGSTINNATSVGVVLYNTDFSMWNTTVRDNAEAGVWVNYGISSTFFGNTVVRNGAVSTTRGGIELYNGATLGAAYYAQNRVQGNGRHELETSGSALLNMEAGHNSVCDQADLGVTGKYVYENGSYSVNAQQNWWGTPSPTASMFFGTVNYSTPDSYSYPGAGCQSSGSGGVLDSSRPTLASLGIRSGQTTETAARTAEDEAGSSGATGEQGEIDLDVLRTRILETRGALRNLAATEDGPVLAAELYSLQSWDVADALGEASTTMALFEDLRLTPMDLRVGFLGMVAERASLVLIDYALRRTDVGAARSLIDAHEGQQTTELGRAEIAAARVEVFRREGRLGEALAALAEGVAAGLDPGYVSVVESDLLEAIEADPSAAGRMSAAPDAAAARSSALSGDLPTAFLMGSAFPNPASSNVVVPFALPEAADVELTAYDVLGRQVATLAVGSFEAGRHTSRLDGATLTPGVYVLRAVVRPRSGASALSFTQRITIVR